MRNSHSKKISLRDYYLSLDRLAREVFAEKVGTTTGHIHQIYNGYSKCNESVAIRMDKISNGLISCDELCPDADFNYIRQQAAINK